MLARPQPRPTQPERDAAWGLGLAGRAKRWRAGLGRDEPITEVNFDWLSAESSQLKSLHRPTAFSPRGKTGRFGSASPLWFHRFCQGPVRHSAAARREMRGGARDPQEESMRRCHTRTHRPVVEFSTGAPLPHSWPRPPFASRSIVDIDTRSRSSSLVAISPPSSTSSPAHCILHSPHLQSTARNIPLAPSTSPLASQRGRSS